MPDSGYVIVDANILFSSLLRSASPFAERILRAEQHFAICESAIVSLFKHKERIVELSKLPSEEVVRLFYLLLRHVTVSKEELISRPNRLKAVELCDGIDPDDAPHVALTLHLDGLLWTGDKALKEGLRGKGFDRFFEPEE